MAIELLTTPVAAPGCCFICGNSERQFYIDTNRSLDFHGAVYFCNVCLEFMASLAGYIAPDKAESLKQSLYAQTLFCAELTEINENLERAVDGLSAARSITRIDSEPLPVVDSAADEQEPPVGSELLDSGTGTSPESVHDERVDDVHSNAAVSDDGGFSLRI